MRKTSYKITNTRKKKQWKCEANKKNKDKMAVLSSHLSINALNVN